MTADKTALPARLSELLFSKMAHDLASPAGATENGLELFEEDPDMAADALALVQQSAKSVSTKIKYYRLCYGTASGSGGYGPEQLKQLILSFFQFERKLTLEFGMLDASLPDSGKKLLLNLLLCAEDALPYGGTIRLLEAREGLLRLEAISPSENRPVKTGAFAVVEDNARLPDDLSPHTVQAWYTGYYAWAENFALSITPQHMGLAINARD